MTYLTDYAAFIQTQKVGSSYNSDKVRKDIITRFKASPSYAKVTVTNTDGSIVEREIQTTATKDGKEQLILSHPDQPLQSGMILHSLRGSDWLIIDIKEVGEVNQEAKIVRMNVAIKWMNGYTVETAKISVTAKGGDAKWDKFFSTPNGSALAFLPVNLINSSLSLNKRFLINGFPYQIIKIDNFSYDNVFVLTLAESTTQPNDTNEVCDFVTTTPVTPTAFVLTGKDFAKANLATSYEVLNPTLVIDNIVWSFATDVSAILDFVSTTNKITITPKSGSIGNTFTLIATKGSDVTQKVIKITSLV